MDKSASPENIYKTITNLLFSSNLLLRLILYLSIYLFDIGL